MKTNWQDPKTSEIISPHISGLQEAVGKIEDTLNMDTASDTGIALSEVYISEDDRYRIYQAPEGKRNWTGSPVIKKNGSVIATGFSIEHGGGAIVLDENATSGDTFTADAEYMIESVVSSTKTARFVVGTSTAGWTNRDCDYLCDGTNDHVEINAAIQALPAGGGEIVILDGEYSIGDSVLLEEKENVIIRGNGKATLLKRAWEGDAVETNGVIRLLDCDGCKILNLAVDGDRQDEVHGGNVGIFLEFCQSVTVSDCFVFNDARGIRVDWAYWLTISKNYCNDNQYDGIRIAGGGQHNINDNICVDNGQAGIYIADLHNTTVGNNLCDSNGAGIHLDNVDTHNIIGNSIFNSGVHGIYTNDLSESVVSNNAVFQSSDSGIMLLGGYYNTISGNSFMGSVYSGIYMKYCERNVINGNECSIPYFGSYTIYLKDTDNNNNLITNNNCMGKAPTVDGGTGNTLFNNKWDASSDFERHESNIFSSVNIIYDMLAGDIFGVSWDKGNDPALIRTYNNSGMNSAIGSDTLSAVSDHDSVPLFRGIHDVEDTLGNTLVRIPKMYIRKTEDASTWERQICGTKRNGFYLPWMFWDFENNRELPYVDIGKYPASLVGTKLASLPGVFPLRKKHIVDFRTYATNNNVNGLKGYQLLDVHAVDLLRMLFFIEFATLDAQAIMPGYTSGRYSADVVTMGEASVTRVVVSNAIAGNFVADTYISCGTTQGGDQVFTDRKIESITTYDASNKALNFSGAAVTIPAGAIVYNSACINGLCDGVKASSGYFTANNGKHPCMYRGIESLFGNIFQFVDGVNINNNQAWVCRDAASYASNKFTSPYEKLSYINHNANGYPTQMGYDSNNPFAEFPIAVSGSHVAYKDYYYQALGQLIALLGGYWYSGSSAGLSCWSLSDSSAGTSLFYGGRLLKKAL